MQMPTEIPIAISDVRASCIRLRDVGENQHCAEVCGPQAGATIPVHDSSRAGLTRCHLSMPRLFCLALHNGRPWLHGMGDVQQRTIAVADLPDVRPRDSKR